MITLENKNYLIFDRIDSFIEQGILEDKKIVLFGLNNSSFVTSKHLKSRGYDVFAYIDNSEKKVMESKGMYNAFRPEVLLGDFLEDVAVLIASKYYPSMKNQLEAMGYVENRHFYKTLDFYGIEDILSQCKDIEDLESLNAQQVRDIQLDIACYVDRLCRENGLNYYMTGGTLLGAVRHKGYIPWDDDIDLTIPVPDYKKLTELIVKDGKYDVFSVYTDGIKCPFFYMRIVDKKSVMKMWEYPILTTGGVSIDVFPLIGMPENEEERSIFFKNIRQLNTEYINSYIEHGSIDEVAERQKIIQKEVVDMMEAYDFYSSEYAGYILSKYWEKDIMPRNIYDGSKYMDFESIRLVAPSGYDGYLSRIFGDYMKLPPENEQYVTHNYKVFKRK